MKINQLAHMAAAGLLMLAAAGLTGCGGGVDPAKESAAEPSMPPGGYGGAASGGAPGGSMGGPAGPGGPGGYSGGSGMPGR